MKRVAVSIGHTDTDPGAVSKDGRKEHEEARAIAYWVKYYLNRMDYKVIDVPVGPLPDKVAYINTLNADVAIEVHLNAANGVATGSESLYYPFSKEGKRLARLVENQMEKITKSRGIKLGLFRGRKGKYLYFLRKTKMPSIIVEPYFIDALEYIDPRLIGRMIAEGISDYLNG